MVLEEPRNKGDFAAHLRQILASKHENDLSILVNGEVILKDGDAIFKNEEKILVKEEIIFK